MKWFFAFNQASEENYGDFARVAVLSARENTDLEPFCLYDGAPSELTHWLENAGVTIVPAKFRFEKWWRGHAEQTGSFAGFNIASGAFLRLELGSPQLHETVGEQNVFYTDCDVIFQREVEPLLAPLRPRFFAVAPETYRHKMLHMNTGAMLMNVQKLREENEKLTAFADRFMEESSRSAFDQGIYRAYFNPPHRLAWRLRIPDKLFYAVMSRLPFKTWGWDDLPLELNWKPYWGQNDDAAIIHFHGLKPTQRAQLAMGTLPPNIAGMHTPAFDKYAAQWDEWLQKARAL